MEDRTATYPSVPPFGPTESYPELTDVMPSDAPANKVYAAVRQAFRLMGLDADHYGSTGWNPLGEIIRPGDRVAIKPNFVLHFNSSNADVHAVVTHGSILRAVIDYVILALRGQGQITVGDAPHGNADFDRIMDITGARQVVQYAREKGISIDLVDFRQYRYGPGPEGFLKETQTRLAGDPLGYTVVDLGDESELSDLTALDRLYGADYDRSIIRSHHRRGRHEYLIANSILHADVVISIPKLKVHSKAGVTINLKNLVGINGDKNWLPHYRIGHVGHGGDEFPKSPVFIENMLRYMDRKLIDLLLAKDTLLRKKVYSWYLKLYYPAIGLLTKVTANAIHRGNWNGNDTVWRMVLDLNRILLFATRSGSLSSQQQRRFLSIVDGILAGEGEGPLGPTPKHCGVVLAGFSPLLVDLVGARLMGLSIEEIPIFCNAYRNSRYPLAPCTLDRVRVDTNVPSYEELQRREGSYLNFELPMGWQTTRNRKGPLPATVVDETAFPRADR